MSIKLFPAIDLKNGNCVRLKQGEFSDVKIYSEEPYKVAVSFEENGAHFLHLVDLDGALAGESKNDAAIEKIIENIDVPVEVGGGIRTREDAKRKLDMGVARVILGTAAVNSPELVKELVEEFGSDSIVVGIDAKNGLVATKGWETVTNVTAVELALKMKECGVKTIIYTDISKDGMLCGPNVPETKKLSEETGLMVVASGGILCMNDLKELDEAGIYGAILGKSLYEGKINLKEAVEKYPD